MLKLDEIKILKARKRFVRGKPEVSILFPAVEGWWQRTAVLDAHGDVLSVSYHRIMRADQMRTEGI
jgi:hypothetical protein